MGKLGFGVDLLRGLLLLVGYRADSVLLLLLALAFVGGGLVGGGGGGGVGGKGRGGWDQRDGVVLGVGFEGDDFLWGRMEGAG